ncbi:MAG: PKD domain-containing protein [Candidatus Bipolaricaulia bacterium]
MRPSRRRVLPWGELGKLGLFLGLFSALVAVPSSVGQLTKTIDLANGEQNAIILGADNNDLTNPFLDGFDSLAVGDINGDGIADLIIGAPSAAGPENRRPDAGEVYIVFGPPPASLDLARSKPNVTIIGADAGDNLGTAVASGDVDGDGYDDIIIGAPSADSLRNERKDAGEVYIIFGSSGPPDTIDLADTEVELAKVFGADGGDNLGLALISGDINDDGLDDVIIGAPRASGPGNSRGGAGEVYVLFGGFSFNTIDLALTRAGLTVFGDDVGDHLGLGLATGDINADGIKDLIIGASAGDGPGNSRDNAGEVYIIFGSPNPPSSIDLAEKSAEMTIFGGAAGDRLGVALASGDFNGDGVDDLAIGAFAGDGPEGKRASAGNVYLLFGDHNPPAMIDLALKAPDVAIFGPDTGDNLGVSLAAEDVDQDGKADLLIGAPGGDGPQNGRRNAGEAYLLFGSALLPAIIDLADTTADFSVIFGADPGDSLGIAVASGDSDGDGLADLIVEAVNADGPGNRKVNSGEVYVVLGSNFAVPNTPPVADAGPDQEVIVGATVQLDGTGSKDPDGDPLNFKWEIIAKPTGSVATLSNPKVARPTFVADKAGDYTVKLTVDDGRGGSDTAQVKITAVEAPPPPGRLKGDVDLDGDVDIIDAKLTAEFIVGLTDLSAEQRWAADVREPCRPPDKNIDVTDVRWIAEFSLELQDKMDCYESASSSLGSSQSYRRSGGRVRLSLERKAISPGETTKLRLILDRVGGGLAGALTFDPKVVQVRGLKGLGPYQVLASKIDNTHGEARFVLLTLDASTSSTGKKASMAAVELELVGRGGGESRLELAGPGLELLDATGQLWQAKAAPAGLKISVAPWKVLAVVRLEPELSRAIVRFQARAQGGAAEATATGARSLQVTIFDLAGREVYASGKVLGETFEWPLVNGQGRVVANGVYLYRMIVEDPAGRAWTKIGKLVVLK